MRTKAFWRSLALLSAGAALWVVGSVMVAFPSHSMSANFTGLFQAFLSNPLHPLSIFFLWVLDMIITVGCLRDERARAGVNRWMGFVGTAVLGFLAFALIFPLVHHQTAATYALAVGWAALACLMIARGLSYALPQDAKPIEPMTASPRPN